MSDLTSLLTESGASLGGWAYPLVGTLAYLETAALVGLFVPGELAVVAAGALAATGAIDLTWTIAVVWAAAVTGDSTAFAVGRRLGTGRVGARLERRRPAEAARVRSIIERHGVATIVAGRFVGVLRAFAPLLAGSAGMPARRFLAADVVGAGLWATCFVLLGHTFWANLDQVLDALHSAQLAVGGAIMVALAGVLVLRLRRRRARRVSLRARPGRRGGPGG
jgi:membrane protein DedA with SNARE-associated domain